MRLSQASDRRPRWQYRLWEFDPTWKDAADGPEVGFWLPRDDIERMLTNARADPSLLATRQIKVQRRLVTYGEPEPVLLDRVPTQDEAINAERAGEPS